jgi:hypothetical protein
MSIRSNWSNFKKEERRMEEKTSFFTDGGPIGPPRPSRLHDYVEFATHELGQPAETVGSILLLYAALPHWARPLMRFVTDDPGDYATLGHDAVFLGIGIQVLDGEIVLEVERDDADGLLYSDRLTAIPLSDRDSFKVAADLLVQLTTKGE